MVSVERINPLSKLPISVELNILETQLKEYYEGKLIQNAFPNLTPDEREFFLSGVPMGLFEIQFEKHFVEVVELEFDVRAEIYFAKRLGKFKVLEIGDGKDLLSINDFEWKIIDGKIELEVNKIPEFVLVQLNEKINSNKELFEFCVNYKNETDLKYSYNDMLLAINEYSKFVHESYNIPFTGSTPNANKIWLYTYFKNK